MVSSREINISVSRQYRDSYVKVHSLTDLLCPKFSLSFSLQIVSLQSMHCCFRRVSLYGKTHTFWFIHVPVDVMLVHRSISVLSCSEAGMGFLAAWQDETTPRCIKEMVLYRGSDKRRTQEASQGAIESIQPAGPSVLSQGVLSRPSGLQSAAALTQSNQDVRRKQALGLPKQKTRSL